MFKFLKSNKSGFILVISVLTTLLLLFLAGYFLTSTTTEVKISRSQDNSIKAYYLTEAGIADMVWKLKNQEPWKTKFETDANFSDSFTKDPALFDNGKYEVSIHNIKKAYGEVIATGTISITNNKVIQRVVKTKVFKAIGDSPIGSRPFFSNGDIKTLGSKLNIKNGNFYSGKNISVRFFSQINIDNDLEAVKNYKKDDFSTVNVGGEIHSKDNPPAAKKIDLPHIDFDSKNPDSYKNKADVVYTKKEFADLIWNNEDITLDQPITYVKGDVNLNGGKTLTVNGLLVVQGNFNIGSRYCIRRGFRLECGTNSLIINNDGTNPSGILAKRKIKFNSFIKNVDVKGVLYANDKFEIRSLSLGNYDFNVTGGVLSRKINISTLLKEINITYDQNIIVKTLSPDNFSPVITVEHWEEQY